MKSLQEIFAPNNQCFGCGPSNTLGLRLKSMAQGDAFIAHFLPKPHHQAFENVLSGGICGTLLDCHSNWCAAYSIMQKYGLKTPPCTVTARFSINLLMPTPMKTMLTLTARPTLVTEKKAEIFAELKAFDQITATCEGLFVAVKEDHPGFHRW